MTRLRRLLFQWALVQALLCTDPLAAEDILAQWPQWRGPLQTGEAPLADPPVEWSETKNVAWKKTLPGIGHSTPIVWNQHVFVTAAIPYGDELPPVPVTAPGAHDNVPVTQRHKFVVTAFDRRSGETRWQRTVADVLPHEGGHYTGSLASASPVTDGELLIASFGSRGIFCLDFDGNVLWQVNLGTMQSKHAHGEGSSPVLDGDTLVVNWDHEGASFVVALDRKTSRQLWKLDREEGESSSVLFLSFGNPF